MKVINKLINKIFKKALGTCDLCGTKIYPGDYHGYERDASSLSITGYFDYYFCRSCIENNCTFRSIGKETLGTTFIISRRNGERSRITVTFQRMAYPYSLEAHLHSSLFHAHEQHDLMLPERNNQRVDGDAPTAARDACVIVRSSTCFRNNIMD